MPNKSKNKSDNPVYDDDISDLGADDTYGGPVGNTTEQPRFRYSTAAMEQNTRWNNKCYMIAAAVFFIIIAIVVTILFRRIGESNDNSDTVGRPTQAPTRPPGTDMSQFLGETYFKATREYVDTQCSFDQYVQDPRPCRDACKEHDCCNPLIPSEQQSCFFNNQEGCLKYTKCHANTQVFDSAPDDISSVCSLGSIAQNRQPCMDACKAVSCCWDPDVNSCLGLNFYACMDYAPCQNLRTDLKVPVPDQVKIREVCRSSSTAFDREECNSICSQTDCCKPDSPTTCFLTDIVTCFLHEPWCENIPDKIPVAGTVVKVPDAPIHEVCSTTNFATDRASCETACAASACCRNSTCIDTDPLGCLQYERCMDLFPVSP